MISITKDRQVNTMQVAIQPSHRGHFRDTISRPVPLELLEDFLEAKTIAELNDAFPSGAAPVWGVKPGGREKNRRRYERLQIGDFVLFSQSNEVFWGGMVASLFRSADLARSLWPEDEETAETYEFMYALSNGRIFELPVAELYSVLDYKPNARMDFKVLDREKSDALIAHLALP